MTDAARQLQGILVRYATEVARQSALPTSYHFWLGEGDKDIPRMHKRNGGQPSAEGL